MELEKLYLTRQSTREYDADKKVADEDLMEICRLAKLAPSAINSQPYVLHAVNDEKAKAFAKNVQVLGSNKWASDCPAFIVIEQGKPPILERLGQKITKNEFVPIDIGILAAYLVLAAENMGIQTCILGMRDEKAIAQFLGLKEGAKFPLVIAVGYAVEGYPVREKKRKDFEDTVKLVK